MEVVRKKMLIKYWDDMYSIGHMALFKFSIVVSYYLYVLINPFHGLWRHERSPQALICVNNLFSVFLCLSCGISWFFYPSLKCAATARPCACERAFASRCAIVSGSYMHAFIDRFRASEYAF